MATELASPPDLANRAISAQGCNSTSFSVSSTSSGAFKVDMFPLLIVSITASSISALLYPREFVPGIIRVSIYLFPSRSQTSQPFVLEKYEGQCSGKNISGLLDSSIFPPATIFLALEYNF